MNEDVSPIQRGVLPLSSFVSGGVQLTAFDYLKLEAKRSAQGVCIGMEYDSKIWKPKWGNKAVLS